MIDARRLAIALMLLGTTVACGETPEKALEEGQTGSTWNEDSARLAAMKKEIENFVGEPRCSQASECAAAAFGSKPCGGPWTYVIYSKTSVDEDALLDWVNKYNQYNRVVNYRHGLISDCMLVTEPRLDCVNSLCVIQGDSP